MVAERFVKRLDLLVERRDAIAHRAHLLLLFGGVGALLSQLADFHALGVALRLELLGFGDGGAALGVESAKLVDVQRETRASTRRWAMASRLARN